MIINSNIINFSLPNTLACPQPTEDRKIARDEVRLLVSQGGGEIAHDHFTDFSDYLQAGDVVVVNTSATQAAAFPVRLPGKRKGVLHFSTRINAREWLVEIREIENNSTHRWKEGKEGMVFELPDRSTLTLKGQFYDNRDLLNLWIAEFDSVAEPSTFFQVNGSPIKYENLNKTYPLEYYQTFFSFHPGSSEMPSAGRGFTQRVVDRLLNKGVMFAPILLHTGVSSLEDNERPYPEFYQIDAVSSSIINTAKSKGKRIVAVGTTAVRAVESATNEYGDVTPSTGNTSLYIQSDYKMKTINALLTGFHEPKATHLHMLQSLAGYDHIHRAYAVAIDHSYFWHQFGDLHLILP